MSSFGATPGGLGKRTILGVELGIAHKRAYSHAFRSGTDFSARYRSNSFELPMVASMSIGNPEPQHLDWISAPMLRKQLGRSAKTLQRLRAEEWPEGLVWRRVNCRTVIYRLSGVRAWCQGRD